MSDFDIAGRISITDDELRKAFDDDIKALQQLAKTAKQSGGEAADAFRQAAAAQRELMDAVGATGAQYDKLRSLVDSVNAKVDEGGTISHSAAIGVGELARGFGRVAQSGNLSAFAIREFTGSAFRLGESLGSAGVGAGIGIAVIGLGALIEYLESAKKKADELATRFATDMESIAHSASLAEVSEKEQQLFSGDPGAVRGSAGHEHETDVQFLGRSQGLQGLRNEAVRLNQELDKFKANPPLSEAEAKIWRTSVNEIAARLKEVNALIGTQGQEWSQADAQRQKLNATEQAAAQIHLQELETRKKTRELRDPYQREAQAALASFGRASGLGLAGIPANFMAGDLKALSQQLRQSITPDPDQVKADQLQLQETVKNSIAGLKRTVTDSIGLTKDWDRILTPVANTFDTMVKGVLQGTQTLSMAFHNLWADFLLGSIDAGVKSLAHHTAIELAKNNVTAGGVTTRLALETWGALETVAVNAWAALTSIANYAWEAVAATWASISAIPFVGPFLAPAMAIGAGAELLSLAGNIRSAAGGYDIPAGVSPFTRLHEQEMVLPAELANKVRGMTDGGAGDIHLHIHTPDAEGVQRLFMNNRGALGNAVAQAIKDNHAGLRRSLRNRTD